MAVLALVMLLSVVALVTCLAAAISMAYWNARTGVPPHPTTRAERSAVVQLLGDVRVHTGTIFELGCGWGGLARTLARELPECTIEAIEISPIVAAWARMRSARIPNLRVRRGDFMRLDLAEAAAVVCYLMTDATQRLGAKLDDELRPDTPVVTVVFRFRGRTVTAQRRPRGRETGDVLLYRWPG